MTVLVGVSIAIVKYHDQKQRGEERVDSYTFASKSTTEESPGRKLEARTKAEAIEESMLLVTCCFPCFLIELTTITCSVGAPPTAG